MTHPGLVHACGTYTLMNESNNEVIDFFISHVRKAGNSQNMEKYGLEISVRLSDLKRSEN